MPGCRPASVCVGCQRVSDAIPPASTSSPSDLWGLVGLFCDAPSRWKPKLYVQIRTPDGKNGAGLGPPIELTPTTDATDVERELVRRFGGAVTVNARLLGADGRSWGPTVVVDVDAVAAAAYLSSLPAAPVTSTSTEGELRAELERLRAQIAAPQTTAVVASDPFSIALQVQRLTSEAQERTVALMQRTSTPQAPSTTAPAGHDFWMSLGERMAKAETGKRAGGTDWASIVGTVMSSPAAAPLAVKLGDAIDAVASRAKSSAEVELENAKAARLRAERDLVLAEVELAKAAAATGAPLQGRPAMGDAAPDDAHAAPAAVPVAR